MYKQKKHYRNKASPLPYEKYAYTKSGKTPIGILPPTLSFTPESVDFISRMKRMPQQG